MLVAALRPLLAELAWEHGERLLITAVVALVVALLVEAALYVGIRDGGRG